MPLLYSEAGAENKHCERGARAKMQFASADLSAVRRASHETKSRLKKFAGTRQIVGMTISARIKT